MARPDERIPLPTRRERRRAPLTCIVMRARPGVRSSFEQQVAPCVGVFWRVAASNSTSTRQCGKCNWRGGPPAQSRLFHPTQIVPRPWHELLPKLRRSRLTSVSGARDRRRRPVLHPRLLDLQEQITRLPEQLAELPAFRNSLAGEEPMLERVLVAERST